LTPPTDNQSPENKPKSKGLSRVHVGLIIAVIFFGAATLGGWLWSLLVLASIYFGNRELKNLLGNVGVKPSQLIIYASAILMVLTASLDKPQFISHILTLSIIASFFRLLFRNPRAHIGDIGGTLLVIFYMVYLPVHFIMLRHLGNVPGISSWNQPGLHYLVMTLAVISASDIGAYYAGRAFGKHLLYPEISPKKTREGAVAGLFAGILLGVITALLWNIPMLHAVILSILLVIVGQLGDLTESMMKRDVGMKDSGELLASHGGFLDRADSYIFSGVLSYYYIYWLVLRQGIAPDVIDWFKHLANVN
jgi:phosphatidate cytidylyltransferase